MTQADVKRCLDRSSPVWWWQKNIDEQMSRFWIPSHLQKNQNKWHLLLQYFIKCNLWWAVCIQVVWDVRMWLKSTQRKEMLWMQCREGQPCSPYIRRIKFYHASQILWNPFINVHTSANAYCEILHAINAKSSCRIFSDNIQWNFKNG